MRLLTIVFCLSMCSVLWGQGGALHQFKTVKLSEKLSDPMHMAIAGDGKVFFVERNGNVKLFNPSDNSTTLLNKIEEVKVAGEAGLMAIALDPAFETNRFVYLYYSTKADSAKLVARFTAGSDFKLDTASKKVLLRVPYPGVHADHGGGGLAFDSKGNLYIGTGDDTFIGECDGFSPHDERAGRAPWDAQKSSANSKDLRGKILRIKPTADGKYTLPEGNLFKDTSQGLGEIYTMGNRNPFRFSIDPKTDWLYWAEPGPNSPVDSAGRGPRGHDEINMTKEPGFFGWPYFIGPNKSYKHFNFETRTAGPEWNPKKPVNNSPNNTGIKELPEAKPAMIWYSYNPFPEWPQFGQGATNASMGGPLYRFNPDLKSANKLPKEFDNTLMIFDWGRSFIKYVKMDDEGKPTGVYPLKDGALQEMQLEFDDKGKFVRAFMASNPLQQPMDMKVGPDGALYVLCWGEWNYPHNSGIGTLMRLDYVDPNAAGLIPGSFYQARTFRQDRLIAHFGAAQTLDIPEGVRGLDVYDLRGQKVWSYLRNTTAGRETVILPGTVPKGMLKARVIR